MIEEMQLIVDMLRDMGASAETAFIWWLLADKIFPYVMVVGYLSFLVYCGYRLLWSITGLVRLRNEMGVGSPGEVTKYEFQEMIEWIRDRK